MKKWGFFFCLGLVGCANQDFPFCCEATGVSDVPYTTTYHFDVGTGFISIPGNGSFISIVSQADVANLLSASNVARIPGTGTVGGVVASFSNSGVDNVILEATDAGGNKVGDLFYNNLGGVPDFSTTTGTSTNGGFTLLNAPPGEIFIKAVQGGRGNASVVSFTDSVSILRLNVVSIIPPLVGLTGKVQDYVEASPINNAFLGPVGLKGLDIVSSSGGGYRFPFLSSDSSFLMKAAAAGYLPTYQEVRTDLISRPQGAVDVTSNISIFSQSALVNELNQTRYFNQNSAHGVLIGTAEDPDGTPRPDPYILITNDQGTVLNFDPVTSKSRIYYHGTYVNSATGTNVPTFFFFDPTGTIVSWLDANSHVISYDCKQDFVQNQPITTCPPGTSGKLDGTYIAFDLPPGTVHLSVTALERVDAGLNFFTDEKIADIFSGSATLQDFSMTQTVLGKNNFYREFSGHVTELDGVTPVAFAAIFALGNASSSTTVDSFGNFDIPLNADIFLDQAGYILKVSKPSLYVDTYQTVEPAAAFKNLILYSSSLLNQYLSASGLSGPDNTRGILTGNVIDNASGRATDGITLEATDQSGNIVGEIRYFDSTGMPTLTRSSSKNGGYIIYNLPPGFIQVRAVSQDDSGNFLTHVYAGGIVLADLHVHNSPPPTIQVSGSTVDLDGTLRRQVNLSVIGDKTRFVSGSDGSFSQAFSPYSQYIVKAGSPGGIDTYNLFQTVIADINPLPLFALTTGLIQTLANSAGLSIDNSRGMIGGKVTSFGFSSSLPVAGFQTVPIPLTDLSEQRMTAGLFNADNEVDLALVNETDNTLTVLLGGGDGTFRPAAGSPLCMPRGTVLLPGQNCAGGAQPVAVRSVDLNGDGIADLVVVNKGADSITILLGTGKGSFIPAGAPIALPAGSRPVAVSLGDFNNDTKTDLIVLNSGTNSYSWIPGNGNGTFGSQISSFYTGGSAPVSILNRDFNGDGNLDLAIVNQGSGTVNIFLGFGNGVFIPAPGSPLIVGASPVGIAAGDLNGDGIIDLVVANAGSNSLNIFMGAPGGLFTPARNSPVGLSASPQFVTLNDVNFDGRPDVITSLSSGNISVLLGRGDGTLASEARYFVGGNPVNLAVADFNDDTFTDMIAFQYASGTLAFVPGIEVALPNVSLLASDLDGNSVGTVRFLNASGNVIPGNTCTDASGRFIIFNVPPGIKNIHAVQGGSGNRFMTSYPGSVTFGNIIVAPPDLRQVNYAGKTIDSVGDQALRFVPGVRLTFLGTGIDTVSNPVDSTFSVNVNANSSLFVKLRR